MKKLLLISLLGLGILSCYRHRKTENNVSTYPQLRIPKCKNDEIKKQEFDKFIDELLEQGYTTDGGVLDDIYFNVWVIDQHGNRVLKTKQWCKIGE